MCIRDSIETIDTELILSDLEVVTNRAAKFAKAAKTGDKKAGAAAAWLSELEQHLSCLLYTSLAVGDVFPQGKIGVHHRLFHCIGTSMAVWRARGAGVYGLL